MHSEIKKPSGYQKAEQLIFDAVRRLEGKKDNTFVLPESPPKKWVYTRGSHRFEGYLDRRGSHYLQIIKESADPSFDREIVTIRTGLIQSIEAFRVGKIGYTAELTYVKDDKTGEQEKVHSSNSRERNFREALGKIRAVVDSIPAFESVTEPATA